MGHHVSSNKPKHKVLSGVNKGRSKCDENFIKICNTLNTLEIKLIRCTQNT